MDVELKDLEYLGGQFSVLVETSAGKLQNSVNSVMKFFSSYGYTGIYISLSKPYKEIKFNFEKNKISTDTVFFVDITSSVQKIKREENILYLKDPKNLTDLAMTISQFIETVPGKKFLIIDSLHDMLIHHSIEVVIEFTKSIIEKSIKYRIKLVIFASLENKELIGKINPYFDKVIEVK